jgi:tetratricopeptide (TPR) repeat protein
MIMDFFTGLLVGYGIAIVVLCMPWLLGPFLLHRRKYRAALLCFRFAHLWSPLLRTWRGPSACYLAATYTEMGDEHRALACAEEAVKYNQRSWSRHRLSSYLYLGTLLGQQGDFERAEQVFDEALRIKQGPAVVRHAVQIHAAHTYMVRGRLEEAEQLLRASLGEQLRPDLQVAAQCALGVCHYYRNDIDAALACVQPIQAGANLPDWARITALSDRMLYLTIRGELSGAGLSEQELLPLLPAKHSFVQQRALCAIARLAFANGDLDRARDYIERAERLGINPNTQAGILLVQAEIFAARHNLHRAVTLCDTVLQSESIDFYKARATALRLHLLECAAQPAIAPTYPTQYETPETAVLYTG